MNQSQIDDLSTEEYSYFLAYGSLPNQEEIPSIKLLINSLLINETSNSDDERELPQGIEDVCRDEGHDSLGGVLLNDACTYTQRSTYE